jgi:hypothetical protein
MATIPVTCGNCFTYIGTGADMTDAGEILREHRRDCEVLK